MIKCDNLVKIYKSAETEVMALQGLDITIEEGEFMAIIGNSGSGKSTFLNMIGALDVPTAGRLYVDGKDLFKLTKKEIVDYKRKTVGFVWQNNARNLLPYLTARENVLVPMMFGSEKVKGERADELLELVGIGHKANEYPLKMSGGEQQRVAIAVALANNPKILLADEPTGAVDVKTSEHIFDVFRKINKEYNTTVVIVTHDMKLADKVNRVASIRDGKISSEKLSAAFYEKGLESLQGFSEFSILDRANRVQIPRDLLEKAGITGNRVKMDFRDGEIVLSGEDKGEIGSK
ncbi:MAG: ABC transporter ATP-binding protein [Lachnospiraceae bacterium]|nr:ABC transporter ATP-binding protein [Lachnospiraceae bacterium]